MSQNQDLSLLSFDPGIFHAMHDEALNGAPMNELSPSASW